MESYTVRWLFIFLIVLPLDAANWYVDNAASGANNGTSWANAWTSITSVSGVNPGDIIYISGGATSKTYSLGNWTPARGNSSSYVTYQTGQDAGHNGTVILDASPSGSWFYNSGNPWYVHITGNVGGLTNMQVINYTGYKINSTTSNSGGSGYLHLSYIKFPNMAGQLKLMYTPGYYEIDHCAFYKVFSGSIGIYDGVMGGMYSTGGGGFGQNKFHHNYLEFPDNSSDWAYGDDGLTLCSSVDIYNNHFKVYHTSSYPTGGNAQHSDGIQTDGSYIRIFNNRFESVGESHIYLETGNGTRTGIQIYNNVFFMNQDHPNSVARGIDINPGGGASTAFQDSFVANNTFVDMAGTLFCLRWGATGSASNCQVENNIFWNPGGVFYQMLSGITIDYNFYSGNDTGVHSIINGSQPFVNYSGYDYHLIASTASTYPRNKGTPFTASFTTDKDGVARDSLWDIGAYEYSGSLPAPVITSTLNTSGTNGIAFSYQITADNAPTSFGASSLPTGLSVNGAGLISGTPNVGSPPTTNNVTITATNASGFDSKTLVLIINAQQATIGVIATNALFEVYTNGTQDRIFTVTNIAGIGTLTGTASTVSPWSIAGAEFILNIPIPRYLTNSPNGAGYGYTWQTPEFYAAMAQYLFSVAGPTNDWPSATNLNFFTQPANFNWANLRAKRGHVNPYPVVAIIIGEEPYNLEGFPDGASYGPQAELFRKAIRNRGITVPLGIHVRDMGIVDDSDPAKWFWPTMNAVTNSDFSFIDLEHYYQFSGVSNDFKRTFPISVNTNGFQGWWLDHSTWKSDYTKFLWIVEDTRHALRDYGGTVGDPNRWQLGFSEHGIQIVSQFIYNDLFSAMHWGGWLAESMRQNITWDSGWTFLAEGFSTAQIQVRSNNVTRTPMFLVYQMAQEFYGYDYLTNSYVSSSGATVDGGNNPVTFPWTTVRTLRDPVSGNMHLFVVNQSLTTNAVISGFENWNVVSWKQIKGTNYSDGDTLGFAPPEHIMTQVVTAFTNGVALSVAPVSVNHITLTAGTLPGWISSSATHNWKPRLGGAYWLNSKAIVKQAAPFLIQQPRPVLVDIKAPVTGFGFRFDLNSWDTHESTYTDFTWDGTDAGTPASPEDVFNIFGPATNASYSLAPGFSMNVPVRYSPLLMNVDSNIVTFTGGGGATNIVTGWAYPMFSTLSFPATNGLLFAPMEGTNNYIRQTIDAPKPDPAGRAAYGFFLPISTIRPDPNTPYVPPVGSTNFYVATTGNDSNPGTLASPFRTITKGYSVAVAGTIIVVKPGTYTDYTSGWGIRLTKGGTAAYPIKLVSQIRGQAIIDGQFASDRNKGIYIDAYNSGGSYHIIDGFQIKGAPFHGVFIDSGCNFNQIINCDIHDNGTTGAPGTPHGQGIYSDPNSHDNLYAGNYIHDNGLPGSNLDHGLYLGGDNEIVINNILLHNAAYGLQIAGYQTVSNMHVYNNVMAYNGKSGMVLWQSLTNIDIKNNVMYKNGEYGIDSWAAHGGGIVIDHNIVNGNPSGTYTFTPGGSDYSYTLGSTITSDPLLVNGNLSGFDSHLTASSPAIGAGLNLYSTFTSDKDGISRPAAGVWDIGAYQYGNIDTLTPTVVFSISATANATNDSQNSFFVNVDNEPTEPTMIWDILPFATNFVDRAVNWRGIGTFDAPQFLTNVWSRSSGPHELIIRGREANAQLKQISINIIPTVPVTPPSIVPPSAPLIASAIASNQTIFLAWVTASSDGGEAAGGYKVYRSTSSGAETFLTNVTSTVTNYTDSAVVNGTPYYYKVSQTNSAGEGALSSEVSAIPSTLPSAPLNLKVTPAYSRLNLFWDAPPNGGNANIGYKIYRGPSPGTEQFDAVVYTAFYSDVNVVNGILEYYQVSAVNGNGEGPLSSEVSGIPLGILAGTVIEGKAVRQ